MTRVLSCIQPTGAVHLGNYLGALRNWVAGQHENDVFHGSVDLHALTITEEPGVLGEATLDRHLGERVELGAGAPEMVGDSKVDEPGVVRLQAEVDVVVTRRKILDYILRPLLKAKYN